MDFVVRDILSRPYQGTDKAACLAIFDTNHPKFFATDERSVFADFLDGPARDGRYLALDYRGDVIGCGGLALNADGTSAWLAWGMIARQFHGKGVGRFLTQTRLALARATPGIETVMLDTSQHTQGFYAKHGFEVTAVTPNGYGPGLDRWDMVLRLG